MGKRILVQRKGRGSSTFRSPSHKKVGDVRYPPLSEYDFTSFREGRIVEILHDPGRGAPVVKVKIGKEYFLTVASEGVFEGQIIYIGAKSPIGVGNILPLKNIPDGTQIFNIEGHPGDGGKFARESGTYATLLTHMGDKVMVQLPSRIQKIFDGRCRATIGVAAGGGRTEKPFVKAGNKYYRAKVKPWKWPIVRGVAMNAVSHPHGGGSHQSPGKPTTVSRNAPPGAKVGLIAARRTGKRK
ncbi:MAG: 50S ribosomal protein L2 [Candidatus Asgardarchaeia archaeon]